MKLNVFLLVVVLAVYTMRTEAILDEQRMSNVLNQLYEDIKDIEEDLSPKEIIKEESSQDVTFKRDQDIPSTDNDNAPQSLDETSKDQQEDTVVVNSNRGHCNNDICDPDRYAELTPALCGYNVLTGEPYTFLHSNNRDPGILNQIFVPATRTPDGSMALTGITASDYVVCRAKATSEVITSAKQYQSKIIETSSRESGIGYESSAEVEVAPVEGVSVKTQIETKAGAAFTNNDEMGKVEKFFEESKGVMVITQAECMTTDLRLQKKGLPPFADAFETAIKDLVDANDKSESTKKREFKDFVDQYGTHYMESAELGANIMQTYFLKESAKSEFTKDRLKECSTSGFEIKFLGFKAGDKKTKCTDEETQELTKGSSSFSSYEVITRGSKPSAPGGVGGWAAQTFTPQILKMELDPIINLFSTRILKRQGLVKEKKEGDSISEEDAEKMRKWVVPMYNNICEVYGYNCHMPKGCGYTDKCPFDKECVDVDKNRGTFTCKDFDHCKYANCEQNCELDGKPKRPKCSCNSGYVLQSDGKSCKKSACRWHINHDGHGGDGDEIDVGHVDSHEACALKCKEERKKDPAINGAIMSTSGNCWCEPRMRSLEAKEYEYDTCYLEESSCIWNAYHDGRGEKEINVGVLATRQQCALECIKQKKINPKVNGATVSGWVGECWCEIGMNKEVYSTGMPVFGTYGYDTCYLDCEDILRDCKFPFTEGGVTYYTCANPDNDVTGPWCSTKVDANRVHVKGNYDYCGSKCGVGCGHVLKDCKFPFTVGGVTYYTCANPDNDKGGPWCSTKVDDNGVHVNGNYNYCGTKCGGCEHALRNCNFPFTVGGVTYYNCANPDNDVGGPWCSTKVDAYGVHVNGNYNYCGTKCGVGEPE